MSSRTFTLGRYTCVERIGVTPVGEQWRAKRFGLIGVERQYLLTKLHPQLAKDASAVARLTAALKSYGELDHDGLLRFFEQGNQGSDYYSVSEFVGYGDLRKLKAGLDLLGSAERASVLLPSIVVWLGRELTAALSRTHDRGLFHGLLSPQSVWLDAQGGVHLADVGLSPALPAASWASDASLKAAYPYMAPELQISGTPTAQSDVYALGMVLQELLGGLSAANASPEAAPILAGLLPVLQQATARVVTGRLGSIAALHQALLGIPLPMPEAVHSALQQVGQQFQLAGDTVPQPVVISERSSAEPLPPPPTGRVVLGKPNLSGPAVRVRPLPPGSKPVAAGADALSQPSSLRTGDADAGGVVQGEEDTPLPMSRPLLVTNPKINLRASGEAEPRPPGAADGPASATSRPRNRTSDTPERLAAARARSGIDWLTSQSAPELTPPKSTTRPELAVVGGESAAARAAGERPADEPKAARLSPSRRPAGPVTINPKAQFAAAPAPRAPRDSSHTPTAELTDEVPPVSTPAGGEDLKWTPEVVSSMPEKTAGTGTYAHLVTSPVALSSIDELSIGETNPSLAPVKIRPPAPLKGSPVGDEPTNQISAAEALAIAEADRLAVESGQTNQVQLPQPLAGEASGGPTDPAALTDSVPAAPPGAFGTDLVPEGSGARPPVASPLAARRKTLIMGALALLGLIGGSGVTYLLTRSSSGPGTNSAAADGGAGHADGHGGEAGGSPKGALAGELHLQSEPAADVYVDGQSRGHTPLTLQLSAGPHKLLLIAEEYGLLRQEITAGTALSLKLARAKLPEEVAGQQVVKVKCKTKGELRILVDGNDTGLSCPTEALTLAPGRHTFGFLRPATEELQEKQQKVKPGKGATKMKVKF